MSWTEKRVEQLKKLHHEGLTASQIAKKIGDVTRNAVIGKIHRLGLSTRAEETGSAPEKPKQRTKKTETQKPTDSSASVTETTVSARKIIVSADQPLPPQPSAHEISAEALANVREVEQKAKKISLLELTERTCKWPVGDPATEEFWFCGMPVKSGKPYCEAHVAVAFQPPNSRRDRRR